jgi:DNA repair protein RadC
MIVSREKIPLPNEQAVAELLRKLLKKEDSISKDREHFWIISLDTKKKVKFVELISIGTVDTCLVSPREVFRRALKKGAVSIILGHNHPSGSPTPSSEDLSITKTLKQAGELLSIPLVDHIILGNSGHYSFNAENSL